MHSLTRGIQLYKAYSVYSDPMMLKDATMSLHHGVELLLKQIGVNTSPDLIFQDLEDAAKKQIKAAIDNLAIFYPYSPSAQGTPHKVTNTGRNEVQLSILPMFAFGLLTPI